MTISEVMQMKIKDYLPKRIRDRVVKVDVDADFDYDKNRSVQHYLSHLMIERNLMSLQ